ncbi:hypothetical protein N7G274_002609 [Stereocaulon virgatum]|uniref:Terpene synthase n=1 Tax=Stereocaulon virgatum TaxID=373712 RepID=A0ABR4AGA2_9LECA
MWSPRANFDNLAVLLFILIWLFTWDDDIEEKGGSVHDSLNAADVRREETLQYVTYSLGFKVPESYNVSTSALVVGFESIGNTLCKAFTVEQRQRFLHNTKVYIQASRIEQELRLCGMIPTIEEYWKYRTDTSAVDVTTSVTELLKKTNMPQYIFDDADMKHVWRETNIMISASNDMFSVKKEMRNGQIDNLITLLCFNRNIQAQEAMDEVRTIVRSARARFIMAAERLTSRYAEDTVVGKQVREFIEDCKYNTTGNLMFSLVSKRYGLADSRRGDSVVFTL